MTSPSVPRAEPPEERAPEALSELTDEELVAVLRAGDDSAYEALWVRYVASARRVASRLAPAHADDLVSEAFLTIYEQIRTQGKGPTSAFRAYLFAVIRNIGARWYRESSHLVHDPDADIVVDDESLQNLERQYDGAVLLNAFRALPERWQRVLWLSEVEEAGRPAIAAELGIRPNAVSALHRRARSGLRVQWLLHQVPLELRSDAHVGEALPEAIVRGSVQARLQLAPHLATCAHCSALEGDLRAAYRDGKKSAASVGGLAALGVVLPAATTWWVAPVTITAAAGIGMGFVAAAGVLLGALGLGLGIDATVNPVQPGDAVTAIAIPDARTEPEPVQVIPPVTPTPVPVPVVVPVVPPVDEVPEAPEAIDVTPDAGGAGFPQQPVITPSEPGTVTEPGGEGAVAAPTVVAAAPASTYMAPVLSGSAPTGSQIAVGVGENTYEVVPTETGEWSFDARGLALPAGTYSARVWTITDGVASAAADVPFVIEPPLLEGVLEIQDITLGDAMDTGVPFTVTGAPGATLCLDSDTGQAVTVPLNADDGTETRRLRFFAYGYYVLRWSVCDDGYYGPGAQRVVSVIEGIMDPWIVDDTPYWDIFED